MTNNADSIKAISIKSNIVFLSAIKILTYLIPLITAPYLSRVFGPDGIGEYSYAYSIVSYFSLAVNFGFAGYGVRTIASLRNNKENYSNAFWSIVLTRALLCIISFSTYVLLLFILKGREDINIWIYLALSLTIFTNLFDITFFYRGLENVRVISSVNFVVRISGLIAIFIFIKSREDLLFYAIIQTCQLLFIAVIPWLFIRKAIAKPDWENIGIKKVLLQAFYYFLPTLAVTLCSLVDKTMLGSLSVKAEVGYYEQADKIVIIIIELLHSFAEVFTARISLLVYEQNEGETTNKINRMFELYALTGIPAVFGLVAIGTNFITVFYGTEFAPAIAVFYFLIPLIIFKSLSNALGNVYYSPRGLIWKTSIFYGIGSIINIITNYFMIPHMGAKGAALASLISEIIIAALFVTFSRSKVHFKSIANASMKPLFASIIMLVFIYMVNIFIINSVSTILRLIIDVAIGIVVYGVLIMLIKEPLVYEEMTKILEKIKNKF